MKHHLNFWFLSFTVLAGIIILASMSALDLALKAVIFGVLIFLLPGLILTIVLFRRRSLGLPERLLFSVGLGLSLAGLAFLFLNALPHETHSMPLLTGLLLAGSGLQVVIIMIVHYQTQGRLPTLHLPAINGYGVGLLSLAAVIGLLALNLAQTPASPEGLTGYTLLWVKPATSPGWLILGVRSEEFNPTSFRLAFESGGPLENGPTLELQPGETRVFSLQIPKDQSQEKPVTVLLYRLDHPDQVYRRVVWWPGVDSSRNTTQ